MVGNHGVSVIAEAYRKGFRGFDAERAFNAIKANQTVSHKQKLIGETYMKYGYFPLIWLRPNLFLLPSNRYTTIMQPQTWLNVWARQKMRHFAPNVRISTRICLIRKPSLCVRVIRTELGKTPFNPSQVAHAESTSGDYNEGNAWQYAPGMCSMMFGTHQSLFGGEEPFLNKLDSLFTSNWKRLRQMSPASSDNMPMKWTSHHITYLYALGRPERTQELVQEIFDTQYRPEPDGLCGNDDCGQMSAWYMFSAMGFYPVDPVSGNYVFGAPQMPRLCFIWQTERHLPSLQTASPKNINTLTALRWTVSLIPRTISHEDILKGGTLVYKDEIMVFQTSPEDKKESSPSRLLFFKNQQELPI